ncbi:MAG TPA: universal stress protein [Blastocatellia bacterium]|nr:universal stress protein [Blastocatellia bacterium]
MPSKDLLVPVDFSLGSLRAVEFAFSLLESEGELCLLHVIDADFIALLSEDGFANADEALEKLRERAEERLAEIAQRISTDKIQVETMVVVGRPFAEILRVTNDLDFEMMVLSIRGQQQGTIEDLFFGSTAEKIIRASRIPVVCVPLNQV